MATYRLIINPVKVSSHPPTVDSTTRDLIANTYIFQIEDFTYNFQDIDGDTYSKVSISSLPSIGALTYLNQEVQVGDIIGLENINSLVYTLPSGYAVQNGNLYFFSTESIEQLISNYNSMYGYILDEVSEGYLHFSNPDTGQGASVRGVLIEEDICVGFKTSDDSSYEYYSNLASLCFNLTTDINVPEVVVNDPPTIGDNTISTYYNQDIILTRQHFIEDTNPAYLDPEGDQPYKLKVMTLPSNGTLTLRGVAVVVGDELLFEGDIDSNEFIYTPDSSRTDIPSVNFEFQVSDTGSQQFVG